MKIYVLLVGAQNSVVNGKVLQNTKFKKIYIPSAGHDAGTAIGAALYLYNQILNKERMPEINLVILVVDFLTIVL